MNISPHADRGTQKSIQKPGTLKGFYWNESMLSVTRYHFNGQVVDIE